MEGGLICCEKGSQDFTVQNLAFKNLKTMGIADIETWDLSLFQMSS